MLLRGFAAQRQSLCLCIRRRTDFQQTQQQDTELKQDHTSKEQDGVSKQIKHGISSKYDHPFFDSSEGEREDEGETRENMKPKERRVQVTLMYEAECVDMRQGPTVEDDCKQEKCKSVLPTFIGQKKQKRKVQESEDSRSESEENAPNNARRKREKRREEKPSDDIKGSTDTITKHIKRLKQILKDCGLR